MNIDSAAALLAIDPKHPGVLEGARSDIDDEGRLKLSFTAKVLGRAVQAGLVFVSQDNKVVGHEFDFEKLSLDELDRLGLVPARAGGLPLPTVDFPNVRIDVDRELRILTVESGKAANPVVFGDSGLKATDAQIVLRAFVPESGPGSHYEARIDGGFAVGAGRTSRARLTFPRGLGGWLLDATSGPGSITWTPADVSALSGGIAIAALLPAQLAGFTVAGVSAHLDATRATWIDMKLRAPRWPLIEASGERKALALDGIEVALHVARSAETTVAGSVTAMVDVFGVPVRFTLPIPLAEDSWAFEALPNLDLPGIGTLAADLANLVGATEFARAIPEGLRDLGGLTLQRLQLDVTPSPIGIQRVALELASTKPWPLGIATATLEDIRIALGVRDPAGKKEITGAVEGSLKIGAAWLPVAVRRGEAAKSWSLEAGAHGIAVTLPDVLSLVGVSAAELKAALPEKLSVLGNLALLDLSIAYENGLRDAEFTIGLQEPWTLLANLLVVNDLSVRVQVNRVPATEPWNEIFVSLFAEVELADVGFVLSASDYGNDAEWVVDLSLRAGESLSLSSLAGSLRDRLLPKDFTLPGNLPDIVCTEARLSVAPKSGWFDAALTSTVSWQPRFASTTLRIDALQVALKIEPEKAGKRPYAFSASGAFSFGTLLKGQASVAFGSGEKSATIVSVAVEKPVVVDKLADELGGPVKWAAVVPSGFTPSITRAALRIDLTKEVFAASGEFRGGSTWAGFAYAKGQDSKGAEYLFTAGMDKGIALADVLPALKAVDEIVRLSSFRLAVYAAAAASTESPVERLEKLMPDAARPKQADWTLPAEIGGQWPAHGLLLFLGIDFGAPTALRRLIEIGVPGDATLRAVALIDRDDPASSSFVLSLPQINLLSLFEFKNAVVSVKGKPKTIKARGEVTVKLDTQSFTFHGEMALTNERFDGRLSLGPGKKDPIRKPLGLPGIEIEEAELALMKRFAPASTEVALHGKVRFGPKPAVGKQDARIPVTARLLLDQGSPALFEATVADHALDVGAFLAQCATGDAAAWPQGFVNLAFETGSRVYYAATANHTGYAKGLHVEARVSLTLVRTFALDLKLDANDGKISGSAALTEPIDLSFVKLAGSTAKDGVFTGGPRLAIETKPKQTFEFVSGLNFLQKGFAETRVGVVRDGTTTRVKGSLQALTEVVPFGKPTIAFSYTRPASGSGQFRIEAWPAFDWATKIVDIIQEIQKLVATPTDGCAAVAAFVAPRPLDTAFSVRPSVEVVGGALRFSCGVDVAISMSGAHLRTLELSGVTADVSATTRFDDVPKLIAEALGRGMQALVQDLLTKYPGTLALLLGCALGEKALEVGAALACRGLIAAAAEAAITAAAGAAAGAGTLAGAALVDLLDGAIKKQEPQDKPEPGLQPPPTPPAPSLTFDGTALGIAWRDVGAASYAVLLGEAGARLTPRPEPARPAGTTVRAADLVLGRTYAAQIMARSAKGAVALGPETRLYLPAAPTGVRVEIAQTTATVSWQAAPTEITGHDVSITVRGGAALNPAPAIALQGSRAVITGPALEAGGDFIVKVRALAGPALGPWSSEVPVAIAKPDLRPPPTPPAPSLTFDGTALKIAWAGAGAAGYTILLGEAGKPLTPRPETAVPSGTAVRAADLVLGRTYAAQIVARSAAGVTALGPEARLYLPAAPTGVAVAIAQPAVTVSWGAAPTEITGHDVSIILRGGAALNPAPAIALQGSRAVITGPALEAGGDFIVKVRALAGPALGPWSGDVPVAIAALPAPTGLEAMTDAGQVIARWRGDAQASYVVEVNGVSGEPHAGLSAVLTGPQIVPGATLRIRVRAAAANSFGAFSEPVSLTVVNLARPPAPRLERLDDAVTVIWAPDPAARSHEVELDDKPVDPARITYSPTSARITGLVAPFITIKVRVRSLAPQARSAWSERAEKMLFSDPVESLRPFDLYGAARRYRELAPSHTATKVCAMLGYAFPRATQAQMAIALQRFGFSIQETTPPLAGRWSLPPAAPEIVYALKTAYPSAEVVQLATARAAARDDMGAASWSLRAVHADLDATQIAVLLHRAYPSQLAYDDRVDAPTGARGPAKDLTFALKSAGFDRPVTSAAVSTLFPGIEARDAAFLNQMFSEMFPAPPAPRFDLYGTARDWRRAAPSFLAIRLCTDLRHAFPNATLTQMAIALQRSGFPTETTRAVLDLTWSRPAAPLLAYALKTAYPDPGILRFAPGDDPLKLSKRLRGPPAQLDATQVAVVLQLSDRIRPEPRGVSPDEDRALAKSAAKFLTYLSKRAGFDREGTSAAVRTLFPGIDDAAFLEELFSKTFPPAPPPRPPRPDAPPVQLPDLFEAAQILRGKTVSAGDVSALRRTYPHATLTQMAIALQRSDVAIETTAASLAIAWSRPAAPQLAYALKTAYPSAEVMRLATGPLRAGNGIDYIVRTSQTLHASHPDLDATQIAVVLQRAYQEPLGYNAPVRLVASVLYSTTAVKWLIFALQAARFDRAKIGEAVRTVFPGIEIPFLESQLSAAFKS